jgi:hypothetical protein
MTLLSGHRMDGVSCLVYGNFGPAARRGCWRFFVSRSL